MNADVVVYGVEVPQPDVVGDEKVLQGSSKHVRKCCPQCALFIGTIREGDMHLDAMRTCRHFI